MQVTAALAERFKTRYQEGDISECWPWEDTVDKEGYGIIGYRNQIVYAHLIAFSYYRYPPMAGMTITHRCKNKSCVNPYHLQSNFGKALRKGERNYNAVLREQDVVKIRKRYEECQNIAVVARAFHVGETTIRDIVKGRTWKPA